MESGADENATEALILGIGKIHLDEKLSIPQVPRASLFDSRRAHANERTRRSTTS